MIHVDILFNIKNAKLFQNGIVYRFAMVAVDDADNKSPLSGLSDLKDVCPPSKVDDLEVSNL